MAFKACGGIACDIQPFRADNFFLPVIAINTHFGNINFDRANVVPLPATGLMLLAGIGGLAGLRRRKS